MSDDLPLLPAPPAVRPTVPLDAEYLARQLEATGFYRTLRRLMPPKVVADPRVLEQLLALAKALAEVEP